MAPLSRRVVAGMATMPSRAKTFPKAFLGIINQVDRLYLYLDGHAEVPECTHGDPRVVPIFASEQPGLGGDGKYLGLLQESQPCFYVGVDDDIVYPPDYVAPRERVEDIFLAVRSGRARQAADTALQKIPA